MLLNRSVLPATVMVLLLSISANFAATFTLEDFEDNSPEVNYNGGHWWLNDDNAPRWDQRTFDPNLNKYTDPKGMLPGGDSRFRKVGGEEIKESEIQSIVTKSSLGDTLAINRVYPKIKTSPNKGVNGSACLAAEFMLGARLPQWGHNYDHVYEGFVSIGTTLLHDTIPAPLSKNMYISFQAKADISEDAELLGGDHLAVQFSIPTINKVQELHGNHYYVEVPVTREWKTFRYKLDYGLDTDNDKTPKTKFYQHNWWTEYDSDPLTDEYFGWEATEEEFLELIDAAPNWAQSKSLIWTIKNPVNAATLPNGAFKEESVTLYLDNIKIEGFDPKPFIQLDNTSIKEEQEPQKIGILSTFNSDNVKPETYSIVGGEDKAQFELKGDTLFSTAKFDYESSTQKTLQVQIQSKKESGETLDSLFTITILPINDHTPIIANENITLYEGSTETIAIITSEDSDIDTQTVFYSTLYKAPKLGIIKEQPNNQYVYTQTENTIGTVVDTVVFKVTDNTPYDSYVHTVYDTAFITITSDLKLPTPTLSPSHSGDKNGYLFCKDTILNISLDTFSVQGEEIVNSTYDIHYALNEKSQSMDEAGPVTILQAYIDSLINAGNTSLVVKAFTKSLQTDHWLDSDDVIVAYDFRKAVVSLTVLDTLSPQIWFLELGVTDNLSNTSLSEAKIYYTLDGTEPQKELSPVASVGDTIQVPNGSTIKILSSHSGYISDYATKTFANFAGGDGSKNNPYQIATIEQLQNIQNYLDNHFVLINDIDATPTASWNSGLGFSPLGKDINSNTEGFQGVPFSGSLKGGYFTVKGLYINRPSSDYVGLFGSTKSSALIEKINVEEFYVTGNSAAGALCGDNSGVISQISTSGVLNGKDWVGSISGKNSGTIRLSHSEGTIIGNTTVGGIAGYNQSGAIQNCYTKVILQTTSLTGGLVGQLNGGSLETSYSLAQFKSPGTLTAGIFGMKTTGEVFSCFWRVDSSNISPETNDLTAKSALELLSIDTYTDTTTDGASVAWDFNGTTNHDAATADYWSITETINGGYPSLQKVDKISGIKIHTKTVSAKAMAFPNPSTSYDEYVTLLVPNHTEGEPVKVIIFDIVGNFIDEFSGTTATLQWDKRNTNGMLVSSGSYVVLMTTKEQQQKIVVGIGN